MSQRQKFHYSKPIGVFKLWTVVLFLGIFTFCLRGEASGRCAEQALEFKVDGSNSVMRYYKLVDANNLPELYVLFDKHIVYERWNIPHALFAHPEADETLQDTKDLNLVRLDGMQAFKAFYEDGRKIRGEHTIESVSANEQTRVIEVSGFYNGRRIDDGVVLEGVPFRDYFKFNDHYQVIFRRSVIQISEKPI